MIRTLKLWYYQTFKRPEKFHTQEIKQASDAILSEFDKEYRLKEINNITPSLNEFKTNMLYSANKLYEIMINASNAVYQKIQISEALYSDIKSELDNKIYNELDELEAQKEELKEEKEAFHEEIKSYEAEKKNIESEFNKLHDREVVGDLGRLPGWFFWAVMLVVGGAELFIYQNVFLSQEIGLSADMPAEKQNQVFWTSLLMSIGFVVMIIWMAHALGKLLRHFANTNKKEKTIYIIKMVVIALVTSAAIWATVDIRSKMHTILADNTQIRILKEKKENVTESEMFGSSDAEGTFGDDEQETTAPKATGFEEKMQSLREDAQKRKENSAYVFIIINIFIFLGGVFLSYFTHTSSPIYEMIEVKIKELLKKKRKLQKQISTLNVTIEQLKKNEINKLFSQLVTAALFYDIYVRTYNAYTSVYKIEVELIESYLREIYAAQGISVEEDYVSMIFTEFINLDEREELQHVNNIEEYMIYHKKNKTEETEDE